MGLGMKKADGLVGKLNREYFCDRRMLLYNWRQLSSTQVRDGLVVKVWTLEPLQEVRWG